MKFQSRAALAALTLLTSTLLGCSSAEPQFGPLAGTPMGESVYAVPEQTPQGTIRISTSGVVYLDNPGGSTRTPFLHIHMALSNRSVSQSWTLDVHEQTLAIPGFGETAPTHTNSDTSYVANVVIGPGRTRTIEFLYDFSAQLKAEVDLSKLDFHWRVQAGAEIVSRQTSFQRR